MDFVSRKSKMAEKSAAKPSLASTPKLNERILSSLSRRSVAAHPWHDLEIGNSLNFESNSTIVFIFRKYMFKLYLI